MAKRGHIYHRGAIYWCWYYDAAGKRIRESTHCTGRRAAEQYLDEREQAVRGGAARAALRSAWTVADALQRIIDLAPWKDSTLRAHVSRAGQITRLLGDVDVALLDEAALEGYIAQRREEKISDHAIKKELDLLRGALRRAINDEHLAALPPFPRHRANYKARERWLTRDEAYRMLNATYLQKRPRGPALERPILRPHRQLWLQVALYTGARFSEVAALDWSDLDWTLGLVRVRGTKTEGADRTIPLAPELAALLAPLRPSKQEEPHDDRGPIAGRWGKADRDLKRAAARIGIPGLSPNDLRRTTASWMVQAGVPPKVIADWLGHKSLDMVMRVYARLNPEAMRGAAAILPSLAPDADCDAGVSEICSRGGFCGDSGEQTQKPAKEKPPVSQGFYLRSRRDSNAGPLASEARGRPLKAVK